MIDYQTLHTNAHVLSPESRRRPRPSAVIRGQVGLIFTARMTPEEAEQFAAQLLDAAKRARAGQVDKQPTMPQEANQ